MSGNEVIRDMIHLLSSPTEKCYAYNGQIFTDKTGNNNYNFCEHVFDQSYTILAHIHPLRQSIHPAEVNYYPSLEDCIKPIYHLYCNVNYTLTPLGVFRASYNAHILPFNLQQEMTRDLNEIWFPIHTFTMNMVNDLSFRQVLGMITSPLNAHITSICQTISDTINDYLTSIGIGSNVTEVYYTLEFLPITTYSKHLTS